MILVKMHQLISGTILLLLFLIGNLSYAQEPRGRVSEEEINTQKVFIDATREKILQNYENAAYLFKEVLKRDKNNHAAAYELARIYDVLDKDEKALQSINMAVELEANPWYRMFQADVYEKINKNEEAAEIYEDLVKSEPTNEYYYLKWAYYLVRSNDIKKAIKVYNELESEVGIVEDIVLKKYRLYLGTGNQKKAEEELLKLIQAFPYEKEGFHQLAKFYLQNNQEEKAAATYKKILEIDPNDGTASIALADKQAGESNDADLVKTLSPVFSNPEISLDLKIKELIPYVQKVAETGDQTLAKQGKELCEILIEVHPKAAQPYAAYADLLYYSKQPKAALVQYQKAVAINQNVYSVWDQILQIQYEQGQNEELVATSNKVIDLFPNQARGYYFNGVALHRQAKFNEAIPPLQQAVMMSRKKPLIWRNAQRQLAITYFSLKKFDRSDKAFQAILKMNSKDWEVLSDYGYALTSRNEKLDMAQKMLEQSAQLRPNQMTNELNLAFLYYRKTDYVTAKSWIEKALQHGGTENPEALERYGDVLFQLDKKEEALQYWQKALDMGSMAPLLEKKIKERKVYE